MSIKSMCILYRQRRTSHTGSVLNVLYLLSTLRSLGWASTARRMTYSCITPGTLCIQCGVFRKSSSVRTVYGTDQSNRAGRIMPGVSASVHLLFHPAWNLASCGLKAFR